MLWRATARGQVLAMNASPRAEATALAALPKAGLIAAAFDSQLSLLTEAGGAEMSFLDLPHLVTRIAVAADESLLACWGEGRVSVVSSADLELRQTLVCEGTVLDLEWSPCKRWLVAGCADKAVTLVDMAAGACDRIVDFPAAIHSLGFSRAGNALIASGAFRVVGWALPDLPFGDHEGTPISTGKPGLTIVDRVAAHPARDLCAVGYSSGLVMLCRIGHPDEMLVREGTGKAITALAWSDDGAHLAIGGTDGHLSIATFPKNMFK